VPRLEPATEAKTRHAPSINAHPWARIAQDLRQMQITANVSEADIGGVAPDRPVTFTVDAFPGQTFTVRVLQVRNNTTTTNNVVTYPTIITVDNPDLKLRPGMTANVTIVVARRENVPRAPNAVLRFRPRDTGSVTNGARRTLYRIHGDIDPAGRATGDLEAVSVTTGLGDAAHTEILSGVTEGETVVTGIALTPAKGRAGPSASTGNPFMPEMPSPAHKRRAPRFPLSN
jgi:HlyD family secretion protein